MDLRFGADQLAFRDEFHTWLQANEPGPVPTDEHDRFRQRIAWQQRLSGTTQTPQLDGSRVEVTMLKVKGSWLISALTPV